MIATANAPTALDQEVARPHEYIPFKQIAAELPRRRGDRRTHVATVYRWSEPGCRGIKLKYVQCGNVRCTTLAWLSEFFERLTSQSMSASSPQAEPNPPTAPLAPRTPTARKAHERAERELGRIII